MEYLDFATKIYYMNYNKCISRRTDLQVLWDYAEATIIQHAAEVRFGQYFINMQLVLPLFDCENYKNFSTAVI